MMILKSALVLSTVCTMNTAPVQERGKGGNGNRTTIQQCYRDKTCDGTGPRDGSCGNVERNENCLKVCDNTGNCSIREGRGRRGYRQN